MESFAPGLLKGWGLGYEELAELNPGLIVTFITPFGQTGPYRHWKGTSGVLDALSGHTYIQGEPRREPLRYVEGVAEYTREICAAVVTLGALHFNFCWGTGWVISLKIQALG